MKISIGSGLEKTEGYVTCDIDPSTGADYIFDLEKDRFPFEDNSVDTVWAHHVLEHLGDGYFHCLKELYRVCQNGAEIDVIVPHHRSDFFLDDPTHKRPITLNGLRLLSKAYNKQTLEQKEGTTRLGMMLGVDFEVDKYRFFANERYEHIQSMDEVAELSFKYNNVIDMLQAILVVRK